MYRFEDLSGLLHLPCTDIHVPPTTTDIPSVRDTRPCVPARHEVSSEIKRGYRRYTVLTQYRRSTS